MKKIIAASILSVISIPAFAEAVDVRLTTNAPTYLASRGFGIGTTANFRVAIANNTDTAHGFTINESYCVTSGGCEYKSDNFIVNPHTSTEKAYDIYKYAMYGSAGRFTTWAVNYVTDNTTGKVTQETRYGSINVN